MTYVIATGGIDLSVGSLLGLGGVVMASLLVKWDPGMGTHAHIALAMAGTLLACAAMGCLNGLLIAWLGIQPFIITLAAMIGVRGLNRWLTDNEKIGLGLGSDTAGLYWMRSSGTPSGGCG